MVTLAYATLYPEINLSAGCTIFFFFMLSVCLMMIATNTDITDEVGVYNKYDRPVIVFS